MVENKLWKKEIMGELLDIPCLLQNQTDFDDISQIITQYAHQVFNAQFSAISMVNPNTTETVKTIYQQSGRGKNNEQIDFMMLMMSGWVMDQKSILISEDLADDDRFDGIPDSMAGKWAGVSIPIQYLSHLVGTITLLYDKKLGDPTLNKEKFETFGALVSPYVSDRQKIQTYFIPSESVPKLIQKYKSVGMRGHSTQYLQLLRDIEAATKSEVRVLLEGETGTGKELVAHAIHKFSVRKNNPFVPVDCGAIPSSLVESELFGHVKGSFTHASTDRKGLIQTADKGILFLDEIGNLSEEMQIKLLRVLQEGNVRPVGSNEIISIDVRVIVASSIPLQQLVADGKFREDLFYRLYVYPISVPSLEERNADIPDLAKFFLHRFSDEYDKDLQQIDNSLLEYMTKRRWKGNIRELENFVERLVTLTPTGQHELSLEKLPLRLQEELQISEEGFNSLEHKPLREQRVCCHIGYTGICFAL